MQSDGGQFVVASAGGPSVLAGNKAAATRISHSASTGLYITQNGQRYVAAVPKNDRTTQTSIVSFVPQNQVGTTATPIDCYLIRGGTFYCSVRDQFNKFQFNSCPRPNRPRRVLEIEYSGETYGGPPGEGVCIGGEQITLKYLDYVGRR